MPISETLNNVNMKLVGGFIVTFAIFFKTILWKKIQSRKLKNKQQEVFVLSKNGRDLTIQKAYLDGNNLFLKDTDKEIIITDNYRMKEVSVSADRKDKINTPLEMEIPQDDDILYLNGKRVYFWDGQSINTRRFRFQKQIDKKLSDKTFQLLFDDKVLRSIFSSLSLTRQQLFLVGSAGVVVWEILKIILNILKTAIEE